jgi:hypothetical protein
MFVVESDSRPKPSRPPTLATLALLAPPRAPLPLPASLWEAPGPKQDAFDTWAALSNPAPALPPDPARVPPPDPFASLLAPGAIPHTLLTPPAPSPKAVKRGEPSRGLSRFELEALADELLGSGTSSRATSSPESGPISSFGPVSLTSATTASTVPALELDPLRKSPIPSVRPRLRIRSRPNTPRDAVQSPALRSLRPSAATFKPLRPSLKQPKGDKVAVGTFLVPKEGGGEGRGAGHGALPPRPDPAPRFRITSHPTGRATPMAHAPTVLAEPMLANTGGQAKIVKAEGRKLTIAARLEAAKRAAGESDTDEEGSERGEVRGPQQGVRGGRNVQRSRAARAAGLALKLPAYVPFGPAAAKH